MTKAEKAIWTAMFETKTKEELEKERQFVFLQDIDPEYWEFMITLEHDKDDSGKINHWVAGLWVVTKQIYPDAIRVLCLSNLAYSPKGAVEEMAKVMTAMMDNKNVEAEL